MVLEDLRPNAVVQGILPDTPVTVVAVQWFGSQAVELTYKGDDGRTGNTLLYRGDEGRLGLVEQGRPWSFDADGARRATSTRTPAGHSPGSSSTGPASVSPGRRTC